jgi:translation initiation factor 2 gamma subunit (eIF-2gamma)
VEFSLKIPVVPIKGDTVGVARNIANHWRLIGFGEVI